MIKYKLRSLTSRVIKNSYDEGYQERDSEYNFMLGNKETGEESYDLSQESEAKVKKDKLSLFQISDKLENIINALVEDAEEHQQLIESLAPDEEPEVKTMLDKHTKFLEYIKSEIEGMKEL